MLVRFAAMSVLRIEAIFASEDLKRWPKLSSIPDSVTLSLTIELDESVTASSL